MYIPNIIWRRQPPKKALRLLCTPFLSTRCGLFNKNGFEVPRSKFVS